MKIIKICLMVMTDGRLDCLEKTIESAKRNLMCDFFYKAMFNDDPSDETHSHLLEKYSDEFVIWSNCERLGFCGNIGTAWACLPLDADYIFHLEDDFTFNEPIMVRDMVRVLEENPNLAQMSLLRQPWSPQEKAAGGIIQSNPGLYAQQETSTFPWISHQVYFTTNPCVYSRKIIDILHPVMNTPCEHQINAQIRDSGLVSGIWGKLEDNPRITHIGTLRKGEGY